MDRQRLRVWAVAFVLAAALVLFTFLGLLSGRAKGAQRIVMERWAETIGTPEEVFSRHPAREMNSAARHLIEAGVPIGLDAAPREERDVPRPERRMVRRFMQFKAHSSSWFKRQLSKTSGPPDPPPEYVAEFLSEFRREIDRIQELLLDDTRPEWRLDLSLLIVSPLPNLGGHVDLNKLLLADALAALNDRDVERAERALESAWAAGEILADEPVLAAQTTRLRMKTAQVAVLRQMPWLKDWIPRLDGSTLRDSVERSLLYEGWMWPQIDFGPSEGESLVGRIKSAVSGSFMRLGSADASERWRQAILKLRDSPGWCRPTLDKLDIDLQISIPWWNSFGKIVAFDIDQVVTLAAQAQLQYEMTRKVLEMAAIREDTGAWPVAGDPWLRSRACPTSRWTYSVEGSTASLELDRKIKLSIFDVPAAWRFSLDEP